MDYAIYLAGAAVEPAARAAVNYGSKAWGGHVGYSSLQRVITAGGETGSYLAGTIGSWVGKNLGAAVAGGALKEAGALSEKVATACSTIGNTLIDAGKHLNTPAATPAAAPASLASNPTMSADGSYDVAPAETPAPAATTPSTFSWADAALKTAQAGAVLVGTVGLMTTSAGLLVPLAFAAANAMPDITKALNEKPSAKGVDLYDDVFTPAAKQVAFAAAGTIAGNIARCNVITNAFNGRIESFRKMGAGIDSYLPNCMQGACEKISTYAGKIDAGRFAMAPEKLAHAENVGQGVAASVELGVKAADAIMGTINAPEGSGWFKAATKVGLVSAAVIGTAGLICVAPELAVATGASATIGVLGNVIRYIKGPSAQPIAAAKVVDSTKQTAVDTVETAGKVVDEKANLPSSQEIAQKALSQSTVLLSESAILTTSAAAA